MTRRPAALDHGLPTFRRIPAIDIIKTEDGTFGDSEFSTDFLRSKFRLTAGPLDFTLQSSER